MLELISVTEKDAKAYLEKLRHHVLVKEAQH